ncbi:hypothetical protein [Sporosarcina sp. ITBMC105]
MQSILPHLITSGICVLFVTIFLFYLYRRTPKIDKGFELIYFKLSYRRKLIRCFTSLPLFIAGIAFIILFSDLSEVAGFWLILSFILIAVIQIIYNIYRWRTTET